MRIPIYSNYTEAKSINAKAQEDYEYARKSVSKGRKKTKEAMESYGRTKLYIYDGSIRKFVREFQRLKGVDLTPINADDALAKKVLDVVKMNDVDFKAIDGLKALIAGGGAGATSGAIAFSAVGALASASTGTAISSLSGAAATNATLAFLGGGSIASGGGGVALGSAVLGGLVAIPALLVTGWIIDRQTSKALEQAKTNRAKVRKYVAESEAACEAMKAIRHRCRHLEEVLEVLDDNLKIFTKQLRENLDNYEPAKNGARRLRKPFSIPYERLNVEEKKQLMITTALAQTIKNILDTNLINKNGLVSQGSKRMLKEGEKMMGLVSKN